PNGAAVRGKAIPASPLRALRAPELRSRLKESPCPARLVPLQELRWARPALLGYHGTRRDIRNGRCCERDATADRSDHPRRQEVKNKRGKQK
ncbi:MAG: hypothetical protein KGJ00_17565, partial [Bradyrhizobium sp.]|nr:hypothetical protein [Bradyrhizobium sp.]